MVCINNVSFTNFSRENVPLTNRGFQYLNNKFFFLEVGTGAAIKILVSGPEKCSGSG
jgi:hypothetical protein